MARPTKYNKAMQAKADEYLEGNIRTWINNDNKECEEIFYGDHRNVIPSTEGLAINLGVSTRVLYDWRDVHESFLHTLEGIQEKQKNVTLNSGLTGDFNATIAKLVLANHGMHDKQDTNHVMNVTLESDSVKL